ncbi:MAG: ABC transporter ATP-binding protein [Anaerolineae bacterium]|nr:ABC transporter ATP-binding protein [Anaerolineae bacterium]
MATAQQERDLLIEVNNLKTYFFLDEGTVRAIDGVQFDIKRGQTLGVVGESGCGKSVTGQSILRIVPSPGRIVEGSILFHRYTGGNGSSKTESVIDLTKLDPMGDEIRAIRGAEIALIFQEPMTSFSPVHTIGNQIMEAILLHQDVTKEEAREIAVDMLRHCGLPRADDVIDRYPWELSGGMRQRSMIAMALSCQPSLLIADEPTTALDVTTEAQILALMRGLQEEMGMAIMYITHNLGVIAEMAEEVIVMYLGKVVERASVDAVFHDPRHPYTRALLRSIPKIGRRSRQKLDTIRGMVPDPYNIPPGCTFHTRCPSYMPGVCDVTEPKMVDVGDGHLVSCLLYNGQ